MLARGLVVAAYLLIVFSVSGRVSESDMRVSLLQRQSQHRMLYTS